MKIISLFDNQKVILRKAANGNRNAQREVYERYAPRMLSVCRQYIRDMHFAEDVMVKGFLKAFQNLHRFRNEGSFEGWLRRIMVREAISYLRKNQFVVFDSEKLDTKSEFVVYQESSLQEQDVQELIDALPQGYKMVFVMYAVEGYSHKDIADMLQISENTSRSQLFKARQLLQQRVSHLEIRKKAQL